MALVGFPQQAQVLPNHTLAQKQIDTAKDSKRKTNHNEAEKRRVKKINDTIDEIRDILTVWAVYFRQNVIQSYRRTTLPTRRTRCLFWKPPCPISSNCWLQEIVCPVDMVVCPRKVYEWAIHVELQSIIPTQQTKEETDGNDSNVPTTQVDYKNVWVYNSIPSIVVNMETGELVKGNKQFYKYSLFIPSHLIDIFVFQLLRTLWTWICLNWLLRVICLYYGGMPLLFLYSFL